MSYLLNKNKGPQFEALLYLSYDEIVFTYEFIVGHEQDLRDFYANVLEDGPSNPLYEGAVNGLEITNKIIQKLKPYVLT